MLKVKNLNVSFKMYDKALNQKIKTAIKDISIEVKEGEIHAVVGSSGSGKSILAHAILDILPNNAIISGDILYRDEKLDCKSISQLRGTDIVLIPQSVSYLDPLMKTGEQIFSKGYDKLKEEQLFEAFNLKTEDARKYPFQLSGGMARRVLIMSSMITESKLVIADEPTPGLNPKLAEEVLAVFKNMSKAGKGVLLITHDIDLVAEVADRISIFYEGTILETLDVKDFLEGKDNIKHPYTKALWSALPQNEFKSIDMGELADLCKSANCPLPIDEHLYE